MPLPPPPSLLHDRNIVVTEDSPQSPLKIRQWLTVVVADAHAGQVPPILSDALSHPRWWRPPLKYPRFITKCHVCVRACLRAYIRMYVYSVHVPLKRCPTTTTWRGRFRSFILLFRSHACRIRKMSDYFDLSTEIYLITVIFKDYIICLKDRIYLRFRFPFSALRFRGNRTDRKIIHFQLHFIL